MLLRRVLLQFDYPYILTSEGKLYLMDGTEVLPNLYSEYPYWNVWIGGNIQYVACHLLMAQMFVQAPIIPKGVNGKLVVNHKDGNKKNYSIDNLEWISQSANVLHAYRHGLSHKVDMEKVHLCCQYIKQGYDNSTIVSLIPNISTQWVSNIRNKKRHKQISDKYFI